MTRIVIAVHGYPPTHTGGAEREAARTARRLAARGHTVAVICTEDVTAAHDELRYSDNVEDGVRVRRLSLNLGAGGDPFGWSYDNPLIEAAVREYLSAQDAEVLHLFSGYLMSGSTVRAAQGLGIPVVVSLMDYWWLCHRITLVKTNGERCAGPSPVACARCQAETYRRYRVPARVVPPLANGLWKSADAVPLLGERLGVRRQIVRRDALLPILRSADAIIAPSSYLAGMYRAAGIPADRMLVWRQGMEIDRCLPRTHAPELRVGYLGQIKPHKGVHTLIDAWEQLETDRPRRLTLYGSDRGEEAYGAALRTRIAALADVSWAGEFSGNEVWEILSALDVVVVPSRWVENSPNSILEAQAVGVPVVGTNLGGTAELVRHEFNGLLFEVDDAADLARQLQRLLDEPALLQRLRLAENPFRTIDDDIDRVEGLYRSLAEDAGGALSTTLAAD